MLERPEPDDVDEFVGGVEPDPESDAQMLEAIAESKRRPDYPAILAESARILSEMGAENLARGQKIPGSTVEHWQQCIDDLARRGSASTADGREAPKSADAVASAVGRP
jgi:hypothetical protein